MMPWILFFCIPTVGATTSCTGNSDKTICNFPVFFEPIGYFTLTQRLGETLHSCLVLQETYNWPVGVYCHDIAFCGLGLDLTLNYRSLWDRDMFAPAKQSCSLITDTKQISCEALKKMLHALALVSRWTCDGGGNEQCLIKRGTECIQMFGNVKCEGCVAGFQAEIPGDESFCKDIDECLVHPDVCGFHGVCVNTPGSYYCRCNIGYISNSSHNSNGECIDEYPGWKVKTIYHTSKQISFNELANQRTPDVTFSDENFNRYSSQAEFLEPANMLMVVYDENNQVREELEFSGSPQLSEWFSRSNFKKSSFWSTESISQAAVFKYDSFGFEITVENHVPCEEIGFLKLACDLETECDQLKWWLKDQRLKDQPCGIVYSTLSEPVNYLSAFWASKIQILSSGGWDLVFMVESFSGVDPAQYYKTGDEINPKNAGPVYSDKIFRDTNLQSKIEQAGRIKFLVYNFDKTDVVSEIDFNGVGHFMNWFAFKNVKDSSFWNFESLRTYKNGQFFSIDEASGILRPFHINEKYNGCGGDSGWMVIAVGHGCPYEQWWSKASLQARFGAETAPTENLPPYILYATTSEPQLSDNWEDGGKIEILTI